MIDGSICKLCGGLNEIQSVDSAGGSATVRRACPSCGTRDEITVH